MLTTIIGAIDVFRKGAMVADAARAKNLSALVGALAALIYGAAELAKGLGYDIIVTPETAQHVAVFIGAVAGLFVTFATSDKVGLLPAKDEPPVSTGGTPD